MRPRAALAAALVLVATAGCSIQPDATPRDIAPDDRGLLEPVVAEGGDTAGTTRVYLVADGDDGQRRLRAVTRDVAANPTEALEALFKGPNDDEDGAGLRSELPADLTLLSARRAGGGTLQVDVSEEILDLPAQTLMLAVAQLVFTANELPGVRDVQLRVNGASRQWPDGSGELTAAPSTPLTVYDYPSLAESTQPAYPAIPSEESPTA
jgi:spore germination protein GerM